MTAVTADGLAGRDRGTAPRSRRHPGRSLPRLLPLVPAVLMLAAFMLGPIVYSLYGSLTDRALTGPRAANPQFIGLDNYAELFGSAEF